MTPSRRTRYREPSLTALMLEAEDPDTSIEDRLALQHQIRARKARLTRCR